MIEFIKGFIGGLIIGILTMLFAEIVIWRLSI